MKTLNLFVLSVILCSCASAPPIPDVKRKYEPVGTKEFIVENKDLKVTYFPNTASSDIPFQIENKTDSPISITWDEASFSLDGSSEKVIHTGVRLMERGSSMPPTVIPPHQKITDAITPVSRIEFSTSGWVYSPICGQTKLGPNIFSTETWVDDSACVGKTFGAYLPYTIGNKKSYAQINFKLADRSVTVTQTPVKKGAVQY